MNGEQLKKHFDDNYTDVDSFLIDCGVSVDHLDSIKEEKVRTLDYPVFCYDELEVRNDVLVPVRKIVKTTREEILDVEWYQLVKESFMEYKAYKQANIEPKRILNCFSFLYDLGWDKWNKSFTDKDVAYFNFHTFENEDGTNLEYYQAGGNGGGSHRLIAAKVGGAEQILAKQTYRHVFNPYKYKLYKQIIDLENKVKEQVQKLGCTNIHIRKQRLVCECADLNFNYDLGEIFEEMYDDDYKYRLEYIEKYSSYLQNISKIISDIDKELKQSSNQYTWLPKALLKRKLGKNAFIDIEMLLENFDNDLEVFIKEVVKEMHSIAAYNKKALSKT